MLKNDLNKFNVLFIGGFKNDKTGTIKRFYQGTETDNKQNQGMDNRKQPVLFQPGHFKVFSPDHEQLYRYKIRL